MVATEAALSIRVHILLDVDSKSSVDAVSIGIENRAKLESHLRWIQRPGLQARAKAGAEKRTWRRTMGQCEDER